MEKRFSCIALDSMHSSMHILKASKLFPMPSKAESTKSEHLLASSIYLRVFLGKGAKSLLSWSVYSNQTRHGTCFLQNRLLLSDCITPLASIGSTIHWIGVFATLLCCCKFWFSIGTSSSSSVTGRNPSKTSWFSMCCILNLAMGCAK